MFSATSVSEHFHVANFGRAPHPFFFLAPSRNRGRGDQGTRRQKRVRTEKESWDVFLSRQKGIIIVTVYPATFLYLSETSLSRFELRGGNRVRKVLDPVPGAWLKGTGIKGRIKSVARWDKCERSMGRSEEIRQCYAQRKGGNSLSAVLLFVVGRT